MTCSSHGSLLAKDIRLLANLGFDMLHNTRNHQNDHVRVFSLLNTASRSHSVAEALDALRQALDSCQLSITQFTMAFMLSERYDLLIGWLVPAIPRLFELVLGTLLDFVTFKWFRPKARYLKV